MNGSAWAILIVAVVILIGYVVAEVERQKDRARLKDIRDAVVNSQGSEENPVQK